MKKIALIIAAVVAVLSVTSCKCCSDKCKKAEPAEAEAAEAEAADVVTPIDVVEQYLVDEIAPNYAPGQFSIPVTIYSTVDESNPEEPVVLGDFWILNYNQAGDTLKCVSGGNHAGKLVLKKAEDGSLAVAEFEQVADGSDNLPSAKRIFGELFDAFAAANSNQEVRDSLIKCAITDFVKKDDLPINYFQDYGWPAIKIER